MKKGDLVIFSSGFFERDYIHRNPGLVLKTDKKKMNGMSTAPRESAVVLWSDGSTTTEHANFLRIVD